MVKSEKIVIKVTPETRDKLKEYAGSYGLTMTSLGAFIIGQWINNQEKITKPVVDALVQSTASQSDKAAAFMANFMAELMPKMLQDISLEANKENKSE